MESIKGWVSGRVQGVGFRYFVQRCAERAGLTGYACNLSDGRVEVLLQGPAAVVQAVRVQVEQGPAAAQVESAVWQSDTSAWRKEFEVG